MTEIGRRYHGQQDENDRERENGTKVRPEISPRGIYRRRIKKRWQKQIENQFRLKTNCRKARHQSEEPAGHRKQDGIRNADFPGDDRKERHRDQTNQDCFDHDFERAPLPPGATELIRPSFAASTASRRSRGPAAPFKAGLTHHEIVTLRSIREACREGRVIHPEMTTFAFGPCDDGVIRGERVILPCSKASAKWVLAATILGSSLAFIDGTV